MIEITIPGEPEERMFKIESGDSWNGVEVTYMVRVQDQDDLLASMHETGLSDVTEVASLEPLSPMAFRLALAGAKRVVTSIVSITQDGEACPIKLGGRTVRADSPEHKDAILLAVPGLAFHAQAQASDLRMRLVEERENLKAVPG